MSKPRRNATRSSVGSAIANARIKAGCSQAELAKRLNRYQSYVAKIETGARRVSVREFLWIGQRLGVNPLRLLARLYREDDFRDLDGRPIPRYQSKDDDPNDGESGRGY